MVGRRRLLATRLADIVGDLAVPMQAGTGACGPAVDTERILAEVLAAVLEIERVPVESNFFDDLGADSLVMARFCARVRKRAEVPAVSMKDVYRHPTVKGLAASLGSVVPAASDPVVESRPDPVVAEAPRVAGAAPLKAVSSVAYAACGTLQLLTFLAYACAAAVAVSFAYGWISAGRGALDTYLRAVEAGGAGFVAMCSIPVAAKWVLIGRWTPRHIRIWSLTYVRFWIVRTLVRSNPLLVVFVGSPVYVLYLRLLGARIGRGVVILSKSVPVCTDLLSIGDGAVVRREVFFTGYRAHAGAIETGPVTIDRHAFVGERSVLDIDTSVGAGAQLGHASALHAGQAVPAGERWHGSPARRTTADYHTLGPARCGRVRRAVYVTGQLLSLLLVYLPLTIGGAAVLLDGFPRLTALVDPGPADLMSWRFYGGVLAVSLVLFVGALLAGLLVVLTVPRALNLLIEPERVYPLYGFHHSVQRAITRLTNVKFFTYLFGDSSYIVHYLLSLGYRLSTAEQTGSNFGTGVVHDTPYLTSVGRGTMVADGLSVVNADYSSTSFRMSRVSIGAHSFLGNTVAFPAQARTGENCLLATKVLVPIDGPIRENVGLLGSPSFEIPRTVDRDRRIIELTDGDELRRRLRAKNRYNLRTIVVALTVRWVHLVGITVLTMAMAAAYPRFGWEAIAAEIVGVPLYTEAYFILVERATTAFRPLRPRYCSIYDRYFWWHERYWKLVIAGTLDRVLVGTPFKNLVSRLLGVRIGRRVFDDGCYIPERMLASIGDDCVLNAGSAIQCHSQEDGTFKSERSVLGARCTLGVGVLVHYGVTVGDGAVLAPDSFLMKGEEVPPGAWWGGNPAVEGRGDRGEVATAVTVIGHSVAPPLWVIQGGRR